MSEPAHQRSMTARRRLFAIGLASALGYAAVALLSRRFSLDVPSADRPHLAVLGLLGLLFVGYLAALREAMHIGEVRRVLPVVAGFAVVFRLLLVGTTPIQEIDLYRYVWDGQVTAAGVSPYRYSPQRIIDAGSVPESPRTSPQASVGSAETLPEDLQRLTRLADSSPALSGILRTIHFAELTTPYPPVSQAVFALAAVTTPRGATVHTHLVVMKAWIVLFDLLTIAALVALLRATSKPVGWCLAYAWCPLVLKEFAGSGHLDAIAVCLTTAAMWQLVLKGSGGRRERVRSFHGSLGALLLGLGIGAKLYPIVLVPLAVTWLWKQAGGRIAAQAAGVCLVVAGACLWPMLGTPRAIPFADARAAQQVDVARSSSGIERNQEESPASGLATFLTRWRMNDLLFLVVMENLDPSRPDSRQPWFAIVPMQVRRAIVFPLAERLGLSSRDAAFLLTRGATLGILAGLLLWLCSRIPAAPPHDLTVDSNSATLRLLEGSFLTLAWFWLLSPTQNPWYWTWCLPLIPFARSRLWLAMSGLTLIYYLRFWLIAHWPAPPGPLGWAGDGGSFFDLVVVWVEFGPFFAALLVSQLIRIRQQ